MMLRILKWRKVGTRVMVQVRIPPHTRAHTLHIIVSFFTDVDRDVIGMLADSHNKANRLSRGEANWLAQKKQSRLDCLPIGLQHAASACE